MGHDLWFPSSQSTLDSFGNSHSLLRGALENLSQLALHGSGYFARFLISCTVLSGALCFGRPLGARSILLFRRSESSVRYVGLAIPQLALRQPFMVGASRLCDFALITVRICGNF